GKEEEAGAGREKRLREGNTVTATEPRRERAGTGPGGARLTICLFGPFEVRRDGRALPRLRSRKGHQLLALLLLRHGKEVERSWLAGALWPDSTEAQALANLRNSLKDLRRALGDEAWRLHGPSPRTIALDLEGSEADVVTFDVVLRQGDEPG